MREKESIDIGVVSISFSFFLVIIAQLFSSFALVVFLVSLLPLDNVAAFNVCSKILKKGMVDYATFSKKMDDH